jgi:probable phosphoglycerate mutase
MERLFIVRHGEVNFNTEGRYVGSVDVELNDKGLQQAHNIVSEVSGLEIDLIITSPLKRCRKMADIIHEVINVPIVVMDEFCERCVGVYEGLTREEAKNKYPELWAKNITRVYDDAPPGGETIREVEERVFRGLNKVRKECDGKNVLIVTHAFVGKMIHKFFHEMTEGQFFEYELDNAEVVEYDFVK